MGQIADDILDGTMCDSCGCYFCDENENLYTHEHPVTCWDCWKTMDKEEKKNHTKAIVKTF